MKIAVIGLGYVGLPLTLAFAKKFEGTIGFDLNDKKITDIRNGIDPNREGFDELIKESTLSVTNNSTDLNTCDFFVVGVPTPIDQNNNPDLTPLCKACVTVGKVIKKGATIVFESTVYPGVTEDICGPIIEKESGLKSGVDFKLGYSPERINPGDREHSLERVVKIVSGQDEETLELVAKVYGAIIEAGVYKAESIKVAEAAKVIENTQRDLNIALMNELAIIFDKMNICTKSVLDAASTKWNFIKFFPGLVGGHCIGVDPYYLTTKAEQLGYHPQVILAGRRINDDMGKWVAQRAVKLMVTTGIQPKGARVGVIGITFKENVTDIRNSRVPDIINELKEFGSNPLVYDPIADSNETIEEYGIKLSTLDELTDLDVMIFAVPHKVLLGNEIKKITSRLKSKGVFIDIKSVINPHDLPLGVKYWSM